MSKQAKWANGNPMNWGTVEYNKIQERKARELDGVKCLPEWSDAQLAAYQGMTHDLSLKVARR